MEYSNYLNLNLPSINNTVDLAIIDDISENFVKLDKKADEVDGDIEQNASDIEGLRIINTASGSSIALKDSAIAKLRNLKVFGKTTQNGTPTPDNPIALKSIGDSGSYEVGVYGKNLLTENDFTIEVASVIHKKLVNLPKGTYTLSVNSLTSSSSNAYGCLVEFSTADNKVNSFFFQPQSERQSITFTTTSPINRFNFYSANDWNNSGRNSAVWTGVQLEQGTQATPYEPCNKQSMTFTDTLRGIGDIRDEIDFERGVYIQRYEKIKLNSTYGWTIHSSSAVGSNGLRCFQVSITTDKLCANTNESVETNSLCTHLPITSSQKVFENISDNESSIAMFSVDTRIVIRARNSSCRSLDDWISFLENNEVYLIYELATPIETPLAEEQLNAYRKLYTKKPNTTIISEAEMEVSYVADPKNYIDNKIAELTALTLEG